MQNFLMSLLAAVLPGIVEYMSANQITWKGLALCLLTGLLAFLSPAPPSNPKPTI